MFNLLITKDIFTERTNYRRFCFFEEKEVGFNLERRFRKV